jgi:hypothetical protein
MLKEEDLDPEKVDILVHSKQIKALIIKRIKDNNISVMRLCAATRIRFNDIRTYLNTGSIYKKPLSHYEILKICKALNLDIRVQVIAGDESSIDKNLKVESGREEKVSPEPYHNEITERFGKITGNNASTFRGITGFDINNTGGNIGGDEDKTAQRGSGIT